MLKLCVNGSNIDNLYETSSVLRKVTETKISGLTFWLRFGFLKTETEPKFGFCTYLQSKIYSHLRDTGTSLMCLLLVTPVAGCQRVLQTVGDDSCLNRQLKIEVFAAVDKLLSVHAYLLRQVPEQPKE